METINYYNININNLSYKNAILLKKILNINKIPAKINIHNIKTKQLKYSCYISKFDKWKK